MKWKSATPAVEAKSAGPLGAASAIIATFGVVDLDGDVTLPGAFVEGDEVVVSSYNHASQVGVSLPVGKGRIRTTNSEAIVDVEFFMQNRSAREAFEVVRSLGAAGQWSYGYKILDAEQGTFNGKSVQFLKSLQVFEVSPVLRGAGIGTRTTDAKEAAAREFLRYVRSQLRLPPSREDAEARELAAQEYVRFARHRPVTS